MPDLAGTKPHSRVMVSSVFPHRVPVISFSFTFRIRIVESAHPGSASAYLRRIRASSPFISSNAMATSSPETLIESNLVRENRLPCAARRQDDESRLLGPARTLPSHLPTSNKGGGCLRLRETARAKAQDGQSISDHEYPFRLAHSIRIGFASLVRRADCIHDASPQSQGLLVSVARRTTRKGLLKAIRPTPAPSAAALPLRCSAPS